MRSINITPELEKWYVEYVNLLPEEVDESLTEADIIKQHHEIIHQLVEMGMPPWLKKDLHDYITDVVTISLA